MTTVLGTISILHKGVFSIVRNSKYFAYHPQILRKSFENHLPLERKKYNNQTKVIWLEFVKVQCSHLDSFIMVRTKHNFHQEYQSFTLFILRKE